MALYAQVTSRYQPAAVRGLFSLRCLPIALLLVAQLAHPVSAQTVGTCEPSIGEAYLDVGNVRARIPNNGNLFWRGSPNVYEVPKAGGTNAFFSAGIWVGGLVDGQLRLAGSTYGPFEFWAGPLGEEGLPPASCSDFDRVYSVSREDLLRYDREGSASPDLRDWPTGLGAPTLDSEGRLINVLGLPLAQRMDRVVNLEAGERPDIEGDQMLWWVMNDRGNRHSRTDAVPMGLEVHASVFAYAQTGVLGNTTFHRYRLLLRGEPALTETYFSVFADPDLGNFVDDYVGSDSVLGLAFVYNSDNDDEGAQGYGAAPPAVGFDFLQVPGVSNEPLSQSAPEREPRQRMTSFVYYPGGAGVLGVPGNGADMYNYMQGRWRDGQRITYGGNGRDYSSLPVNFMFPGDPPEFWSEFDVDGRGGPTSPADRRFISAGGPFDMDSTGAQVTFAIITSFGADHLDSVRQLKDDSRTVQTFYDSGLSFPRPPDAPQVAVTADFGEVLVEWSNARDGNNHQDGYRAVNTTLPEDIQDREYRLEGYNVLQFESPSDSDGRLLAVFDVVNGVKRVTTGDSYRVPIAFGTDSGLQHSFRIQGLTNYRTYHFGVQAYAYNANSEPRVLFGPITRFEAVPANAQEENAPALQVGITPNPYKGASDYEVSSLTDEVRFTNMPQQATVRVFQLSGTLVRTLIKNSPERFLTWDLRTDNNLPIGSGLYLIHVETEDGDQVLKFSVAKKKALLNAY